MSSERSRYLSNTATAFSSGGQEGQVRAMIDDIASYIRLMFALALKGTRFLATLSVASTPHDPGRRSSRIS